MKQFVYIIFIFMLAQFVIGDANIFAGDEFEVFIIDKCVGDFQVKVEQKIPGSITYILGHCVEPPEGNIWNCLCINNKSNVTFKSNVEDTNEYDFIIQYYVGKQRDETNKRVKEVNNVKVMVKKKKEPFKFPGFSDGPAVFLVVGIVVSIIIAAFIFIFKYIMSEKIDGDEPIKPKAAIENKDEDEVDKELNDIMNGL